MACETTMNPVIYLDMDGVCTDFASASILANGRDPKKVFDAWKKENKNAFLPYIVMDIDKDEYWEAIHSAGENFWIGLNEYPWFNELYKSLTDVADVIFLSATTRDGSCLSGKLNWLQKRFGREFQKYIFTAHKHRLANKNSILIDDYEINTSSFIKHGGSAVLFPQIWNSNHYIISNIDYTIEQVYMWRKNL